MTDDPPARPARSPPEPAATAENPYTAPVEHDAPQPGPEDAPSLSSRLALMGSLGIAALILDLIVPIPIIKSALIGFICGWWTTRRMPPTAGRDARRYAAWTATGTIAVEYTIVILISLAGVASGYRSAVSSIGGWIVVVVTVALGIEVGVAALLAWDTVRRAQRSAGPRAPTARERACDQCGHVYRLDHYRSDATEIFCEACKAPLPGPAAVAPDQSATHTP